MIRALIFDFDGLILDTETPELIAWQETFSSHGAELTLETWIDCVGRPPGTFDPCSHLEETLGRSIEREQIREATRARARSLIAEETVRPGVLEWLDEAKSLDLRLAVASSSSRDWVHGHLERFGILERFETFVCHEDVDRHKPDPAPYLTAIDRMGIRPEQAIAIEDSSHGLQAALGAGLWCVAVPNHVTRASVADLGHLQLQSLADRPLSAVVRYFESRG